MEILARRLNMLKSDSRFSYHPKCKKIGLNHLMFADDVLIFSRANIRSMNAVKDALRDFQHWSGLIVNHEKSSVLVGGLDHSEASHFASHLDFKLGRFPFKYLGMPIDGVALKDHMYEDIIEKMTGKISSWSARKLSYAGRLVLVKHVLQTISSYWMRIVVFPAKVIKRITAICRNYLWSGQPDVKKQYVAWRTVCRTTDEGGLGIKDLKTFNIALKLSQIWKFCSNKDSIWTKWLNSYFIRPNRFWMVQEKAHMPWVLKGLLRLRGWAQQCVNIINGSVMIWKGNEEGFSVSSTYKMLMGEGQIKNWAELVWAKWSPPKHNFCVWLAIQNKLWTMDRIRWGERDNDMCCWCNSSIETNDHIFFQCRNMQVMKNTFAVLGYTINWSSWEDVIQWRISTIWKRKADKEITAFIINCAIYETWKNRNDTRFRNNTRPEDDTRKTILNMIKMKLYAMKQLKKWKNALSWHLPNNL